MAGGYSNPITGLGMPGMDSRMASTFTAGYITDEMAAEMWRGDAIAQKIVSMLPKEALEPGITLTIQDEQLTVGGQVDSRAAGDLVEDVERMHRELGTEAIIKRACEWERLFGGAAIWAGANDYQAGNWAEPLNLEAPMLSVRWLDVLRSRDLTPARIYTDPLHPKYGKVETWRLSRVTGSGRLYQSAEIHESRLFLFRGSRIVDDGTLVTQNMQSTEFGDGIMIAVQGALRRFQEALDNTEHTMRANGELLWQHNRLSEILANEGEDDFRKLVSAMSYASSILRARVVGADQTLTRQSVSLAGLADVVTKFENELCALAGIPRTKLFGESPGGLGNNAEGPHGDWDETKATYRKDYQLPAYEWVTKLAFRSLGGEPRRWKLEGNPYRHPTKQEQGAIVQLEANTDIALSQAGIVTQAEVRARTIWRDRYALPDPEATAPELGAMPDDIRDPAAAPTGEEAAELAPEGQPAAAPDALKAADLALNGAQALALSAIIEKVAAGIIPRASGVQLVQFGFKVPADQADAMMPDPNFQPEAASPGVTSEPVRADTNRTMDGLIKRLAPSGKCDECGKRLPLEVDHVHGRGWDPAELSSQQRAARYWQEHDDGVKLRALCRSCNGSNGAKNKQGKSGPAHRGDAIDGPRDDARTPDEIADIVEKLRGYQHRALLGEERDALVASLELVMDVPCEMAERLIPLAPKPGWSPPDDDDDEIDIEDDLDDETRDDCANPLRQEEGGLFAGCAPGDGPAAGTGTRAATKVAKAAAKPATKKLTPKQKAAAKAKAIRQKKAERAKKLREKKRAAKVKAREKAQAKRAKEKERIAARRAKEKERKEKLAAAKRQKLAAAKAKQAAKNAGSSKAKPAPKESKAPLPASASAPSKPLHEITKFPPPPMPSVTKQENDKRKVFESLSDNRSDWDKYVEKYDKKKDDPPLPMHLEVQDGMSLSASAFHKERREFASMLDRKETDAAIFYSADGFIALNGAIRGGTIGEDLNADLRDVMSSLDAAITKGMVKEDTYVARGITGKFTQTLLAAVKEGSVFEEPGYTSTSATEPFRGDGVDDAIKMRILLPKGSTAAPIPSAFNNENEYLLPRGSRFRVVKIKDAGTDTNGGRLTEMDVELVQ